MRKVILHIAASLDGFIARADGDIEWLVSYQQGDEDYGYHDFYAQVGASIMGAATYEKGLTLPGGIDERMPTYVVTHRHMPQRDHRNVVLHGGGLPALLEVVRKQTDKDI